MRRINLSFFSSIFIYFKRQTTSKIFNWTYLWYIWWINVFGNNNGNQLNQVQKRYFESGWCLWSKHGFLFVLSFEGSILLYRCLNWRSLTLRDEKLTSILIFSSEAYTIWAFKFDICAVVFVSLHVGAIISKIFSSSKTKQHEDHKLKSFLHNIFACCSVFFGVFLRL